jgi:hypothetical protein
VVGVVVVVVVVVVEIDFYKKRLVINMKYH